MMEKEMEVHGAETRKSPVSQSLYEHKQDEVDFLMQTQFISLEQLLAMNQYVGRNTDIKISGGIMRSLPVQLKSIPSTRHYQWVISTDKPSGTEVSSLKEKLKDGTEWHISLTFKTNKIKLFLHLKPNCEKQILFQYILVSNGCEIEKEKKRCLFTLKLNKHWISTIKKEKIDNNFMILKYMIEEDSGQLNSNVDVKEFKIPVQTGKTYCDIAKLKSLLEK